MLAFLVVSVVSACQNPNLSAFGDEKTYRLRGESVSFVAPPSPWVESLETLSLEEADLGQPSDEVLGVIFRKPEAKGLISVTSVEQHSDEAGVPIELENDQETLNQIALWVVKRDGEILKQEYIKVLGVNAFYMIFEYGSGATKEKGEQVHFTRDGRHYTLSLLVPASDYGAEVHHFQELVQSFQVKADVTPEAEA